MEPEREFKFTRDDFDCLRGLVTQNTGIIADEDKFTLYYSRLARRVRKLGLQNFSEYCSFLNQNLETELIELVNSVTTNLTSFFRENYHFEFLKDTVIPVIKKTGTRKMRIWSAGCSSGEEPYSIAISLAQAIPDFTNWDIKILATDLDSSVVKTAAEGVYDKRKLDGVDGTILNKYFMQGESNNTGFVKVIPELVNLIEFKQQNLLHKWPLIDRMDFIFCRNVVIYFDRATKNKLVDRYADLLVEGGYLFMGHSESLFKSSDRFKLLGKTIYQKTS